MLMEVVNILTTAFATLCKGLTFGWLSDLYETRFLSQDIIPLFCIFTRNTATTSYWKVKNQA